MIQNNPIRIPQRADKDYVVYFYESGISTQYLQRQRDLVAGLNYGPPAQYDFTSDLTHKKAWPVPQTVEDVVRNGYFSTPKSEPEFALISDKSHTARLGLDDVIGQIRQRHEVYERNIFDLDISKCAAINALHEHEAYHGPSDSKVEYAVNKRLDGLYSEQREERVNLWRDVSRLRLLLPENAQQYLSAYRKLSILEDTGGDPL